MTNLLQIGKKYLKLFLGVLFSSAAVTAVAQEDCVKVLFIGNSYTHMNAMPKIFEKIATTAGQKVIAEHAAKSGASFQEHSTREDLYQAIKKRKWDYVILQGYSRELSHSIDRIDSASVPYVQILKDSILENNPCTQILFYMTWGYDEGYLVREEVNTFEKMADSIARGYSHLGKVFDLPVVPIGMIWKEVRNSTDVELYVDDRAHPSKNGSFLIAATFYNAIFNTPLDKVFTNTIQGEEAKKIKKIIQNFMAGNRELYGLDKNQFEILNQSNGERHYISYLSNFPDSLQLIWDFGDGEITEAAGGIHVYQKPGKYEIKLTVLDACGLRKTYRKWVEIKAPKPAAIPQN